MPAFSPGLRLSDRYRLERAVASGRLWLAHDELLGRPVAIRLTTPAAARAAASVSHPHVAQVLDFDFGDFGDFGGDHEPYLVTELVDGEDLEHRLTRGDLTWLEAARISAQIAGALAAAHAVGVVHGDVHPGTIRLTRDGAKLTGLGLSSLAGTPASDVYALGVLLRTLLPASAPSSLRVLAERCRSVDPEQRPSSQEAARGLRAATRRRLSMAPMTTVQLPVLPSVLPARAAFRGAAPMAAVARAASRVVPVRVPAWAGWGQRVWVRGGALGGAFARAAAGTALGAASSASPRVGVLVHATAGAVAGAGARAGTLVQAAAGVLFGAGARLGVFVRVAAGAVIGASARVGALIHAAAGATRSVPVSGSPVAAVPAFPTPAGTPATSSRVGTAPSRWAVAPRWWRAPMAAAASMVLVAGVVLAAVGAAELTLSPAPVPVPEIVAEPPLPYQHLAPQLADPPAPAPIAMAAEAPPVVQAPVPVVEDPAPADDENTDTDADAPDPTPWNLQQRTRRDVIRCFAELRDYARALRTSPATTPPPRPCTHL